MIRFKLFLILFYSSFLFGCSDAPKGPNPKDMSWAEIEEAARDTNVNMLAWMGDAATNRYLEDFVAPRLLEDYGITIEFASIAGPRIISFIMAEREAQKQTSEADMVWMAGRQSHQMRKLDALYGPFTDLLPNSKYVVYQNLFVGFNNEIPLGGMEAPWGQGQFLLITDKERVPTPPQNMDELEAWIMEHPGRFTFDPGFTTLSFLKILLVEVSGNRDVFSDEFNEDIYNENSKKVWNFLNRIRPYMWREGKAFARSPAQLHQMFTNGEVDFSMSFNDRETDKKITQGVFPETAYSFTWNSGTPKNATYLSIINNAPNKAGAMVVINFLISPEAQLEKLSLEGMGDGSILEADLLPTKWKDKFLAAQSRQYSPTQQVAEQKAFADLRPEYITRLYNDFIKKFINASS